MRILTWNCRGLRRPLTIHNLKGISQSYSPELVFICETKNQTRKVEAKLRSCGFSHWHIVNPNGIAGGLVMAWKEGCNIKVTSNSSFYIQAIVKDMANNEKWSIIGVHLSYSEQVRTTQFQEISAIVGQNQGGIALLSDFNSITTLEKKAGGGDTSLSSMTAFNLFIDGIDLVDLGMIGRQYTWSNRRAENELIQKRLDRKAIETLKARLEEIRTTGICSGTEIHEIESKLEKAYLNEEMYWKEKSRVKWVREGDRNTAFFHRKFKVRTMGNKIWRLVGGNGEVVSFQADIAGVAEEYFTGIFSSTNQEDLEPFLADFEPKVTTFINRRLQNQCQTKKLRGMPSAFILKVPQETTE
ncbi:uncharacterized protein [Arachis hypogaea]|uniref:uncharacterized protein n=1 Tax=Arachis hypogaea TaxID=3818 RepID=UPI000DED3C7E|nr:uncharacterized protein LOC112770231 [Arachis hypogaea]